MSHTTGNVVRLLGGNKSSLIKYWTITFKEDLTDTMKSLGNKYNDGLINRIFTSKWHYRRDHFLKLLRCYECCSLTLKNQVVKYRSMCHTRDRSMVRSIDQ